MSLDEVVKQNHPKKSFDRPIRQKRFSSKKYETPYAKKATVTNRVYVGNLSWETSWQALKDHCRKAGNVAYAGNRWSSWNSCGKIRFFFSLRLNFSI
jgi:RNA recognition motif-containing protein